MNLALRRKTSDMAVEALYLFNEHNNVLFEHYYGGRPLTATSLLQFYLKESTPRPALIHLPNTSPPTLLFSHLQDQILFLCPTSSETEPLLVSEFLHRVADALEEFLGPPLLSSKIEANYDVVVQVVGEICDAGVVHNTEPNALREVVEVDDWMGNLLGGIGLPSYICPGRMLASAGWLINLADLPQLSIVASLRLWEQIPLQQELATPQPQPPALQYHGDDPM